jgi:hypothetical protein
MTVALTGVALALLVAGNGWAQPTLSNSQTYIGSTGVTFAGGSSASAPVLQVKGNYGGHFKGGGWGWSYGWPGWYGGSGYPYRSYGGSYLDTPNKTCVWNGYEYKCYTFSPNEM